MASGIPFALGLAGLGGYKLARRALRPMVEMAQRAREINAEKLSTRLEFGSGQDEVGQLAAAFNETLGRLEASFDRLRRFTADAAHELRTPLTAIRSVGEVGLQQVQRPETYREVIESMLEEAARLSRLVEGLLAMARADAGQVRLERTSLPALDQVREVSALLEVLAEEKRQKVEIEGDADLCVGADRVIFRQIVINLLDNAIKYSPEGSAVKIRVAPQAEDRVMIEVADRGPGIPREQRERVFDRFYRMDQARSRNVGGAGLGLSIAQWGAQAHGGSLTVAETDQPGCTFQLVLPGAPRRTPV
jgi:heavy metal sensor kinase